MISEKTFYDTTPFEYGYSSKKETISNMHPLLKKLIENNEGKTFYDIGCGCGRNLLYASNFASKLIGVDLSKKSLKIADDFVNSDQLELIQADNLDLPIDSEIADVVISDGVCHHTGDTSKAFSECVRILKPGGKIFLAVYKKFRYYPFLYFIVGGFFRLINRFNLGNNLIEIIFVKVHYFLYKIFKTQKLTLKETRNIFYDYFITPIATFHSKEDIIFLSHNNCCKVIEYSRTSGNCHVFIIQKNE